MAKHPTDAVKDATSAKSAQDLLGQLPGASRIGSGAQLTVPRVPTAIGALTAFAVLGVPLTVSFDSYLYVQSSRHIFTSSALTGYHWIREPLYPLIIKAVRVVGGNADVWLIWAQLAALGFAAYFAARAILGPKNKAVPIAVLAVMFNPIAVGYAGAVLQTTWIMLILSLNCALVAAAWRDPRPSIGRYMLAFVALTIASSYLSFQLGYLSFATGFGLGLAYFRHGRFRRLPVVGSGRRSSWSTALVAVATAVLVALTGLAISRVSLLPWNAYKNTVTGGAAVDELGLGNQVDNSPQGQLRGMLRDPQAAASTTSTTALQLLGLKTPLYFENAIFGTGSFTRDRRCGKFFWAETIPEPVADTAASIQATCKSRPVHLFFRALVWPGEWLYRISSMVFLIAPLVLVGLRRWGTLLALGPAWFLIFMYASVQMGIDRYGIPVYPAAVSLVVLFATDLWSWLRRTAHHEHGELSQSTAPDPVGP